MIVGIATATPRSQHRLEVLARDDADRQRAEDQREERVQLDHSDQDDDHRDASDGLEMSSPNVVMGVSGSGKSTVGAALAQRLRVPFADVDDFHPEANVAKMAAGHALSDEDRYPWLEISRQAFTRRRCSVGSRSGASRS